MLVRHLRIRNFRGVRSADIQLRPGVNCLLGPGDVGKTTVLDAIEWVGRCLVVRGSRGWLRGCC